MNYNLYRKNYACSTANKLIIKSSAESNLECIKDASKNPKRLWSKIKSLLHSSPPAEQLSPSLSQPLANSLASFFCQKIVALKELISFKLHGGPSPFNFDQPHATELLSDFAPVTLLQSLDSFIQCQINHLSSTISQLLFSNHVLILSLSSSPIFQTYLPSFRPPGLQFIFFIIYFVFSTDIWLVISCVLLLLLSFSQATFPTNFKLALLSPLF